MRVNSAAPAVTTAFARAQATAHEAIEIVDAERHRYVTVADRAAWARQAWRAYELGLVSEVVAHDRLLERAREVAELVNRNAPLAVRGTRLAIRKGLDLPLHEAEILAEAFRERVLRTDDAKEGPLAFMEKRAPKWTAS